MIIGYSRKIQGLFRLVLAVSIVGRYDPIWPIRTDSANRPEFELRRCESVLVMEKKKENAWQDAASTSG